MDYNYYETETLYPELKIISDNFDEIKEELNNNQDKWKLWKDIVELDRKDGWKTIPLGGFGRWTSISEDFPILKKYISDIDGIKLISYSKLEPGTILDVHRGWIESNDLIRNHIGIIVPEKCGLWVEGEIKYHETEKWLSFDDSKNHSAFNKSDEDRIVLIIDMVRPDTIKRGDSTNATSSGLKKYINNC
jgi:ornithine lipid ester-linked acyl 2-hydroxylase